MRLGDLDALKSKAVKMFGFGENKYVPLNAVQSALTIDAVPVVRCKDCKHGVAYNRMDGQTGYYCHQPNTIFRYGVLEERKFTPVREEADFCSYGERKDGEG